MSIMNAMFSGSSALSNYGNAMSVIGNNLSNSNTTAYKRSTVTFEDILAATVGSNEATGVNQVGNGVSVSSITQTGKQGSFEYTANVNDLAIDGAGYFVVKDVNADERVATFFTRAGDFKQDLEGYMVTNSGLRLQGKELDENGNPVSGASSDINLSKSKIPARASSTITLAVNLNAESTVPTDPYDPTDTTTYNYATTVRIYDSVGAGHNVEIQFRKIDGNKWDWYAVVASDDLDSAYQNATNELTAVNAKDLTLDAADSDGDGFTTDNLLDIGTTVTAKGAGANYTVGTLEFTESGVLKAEGSTPVTFYWDNNVAPQQVLFNFGGAVGTGASTTHNYDSTNDFNTYDRDPTSATYLQFTDATVNTEKGYTGSDATVQFATGHSTLKIQQDGFPAGFLERLAVDSTGRISGSFDNGQVKPMFQISMAKFPNPMALEQIGANLYAETYKSGNPVLGVAESSGFGTLRSHSLEQSNVDLSEEFVKMISVQRSFQANSRVVSVVDGMLEELVNLKR